MQREAMNLSKRVYCAGPLFNEAERLEMVEIGRVLRKSGYEPFVPHDDGMEFAEIRPLIIERGFLADVAGELLHRAIFALDAYQVIVGCDSLVVNLNGRVPDEGAVAESTMAWMLGKPIVGFKSDVRTAIEGRDNPLVVGPLGFRTVSRLDEIPLALAERIEAAGRESAHVPHPRHLEQALREGRSLWEVLAALPMPRPRAQVADAVLEIFAGSERVETR